MWRLLKPKILILLEQLLRLGDIMLKFPDVFIVFVLCELIVESQVVEHLSGWKLLLPRLCGRKSKTKYSVLHCVGFFLLLVGWE
jgi:hypothetical protein